MQYLMRHFTMSLIKRVSKQLSEDKSYRCERLVSNRSK